MAVQGEAAWLELVSETELEKRPENIQNLALCAEDPFFNDACVLSAETYNELALLTVPASKGIRDALGEAIAQALVKNPDFSRDIIDAEKVHPERKSEWVIAECLREQLTDGFATEKDKIGGIKFLLGTLKDSKTLVSWAYMCDIDFGDEPALENQFDLAKHVRENWSHAAEFYDALAVRPEMANGSLYVRKEFVQRKIDSIGPKL